MIPTICLSALTIAPHQQTTVDREFLGLKGPIKSVVSKVANVSSQAGEYFEHCCEILYSFTFDTNGKSNSGKFEMHITDFGPVGTPLTKKPIYDGDGKLISAETYKPDGTLDRKTTYTYDDRGNRVEERDYSVKGNLTSQRRYTLDARHLLIEEIIYLFNGTPSTRWTYDEYDPYGNCVKRTAWNWRARDGKSDWGRSSVYYKVLTYY
jgi:hypothetical protein